jgi:hypothetical protein
MVEHAPPEILRREHTFWIAISGIAAVVVAMVLTLCLFYRDLDTAKIIIPAVLTAGLTVIGTLVGAVAGHAAGGAAGAAMADAARSEAEAMRKQIRVYERELPAETAKTRKDFPDEFKS